MELTLTPNMTGGTTLRLPQSAAKSLRRSGVSSSPKPAFVAKDREVIHAKAIPLTQRLAAEYILLLSAPITIAAIALVAVASMLATGFAVHAPELFAAGVASLGAGIIAVLPLFQAMRMQQEDRMISSTMMSIGLRVCILLGGTYLATGPGFGLHTNALIGWMLTFYFPMLLAETVVMVWILRKLDAR